MSLRFCFGCSGSGKSTYIYNEIIEKATKEFDRNFLIVVPDQYTMQTQKEMVAKSPNNCIMNIDVLSFSRLSHRIFEECGYDSRPVLDDTGKSLILRKIAGDINPELPILGRNLNKQGYIHEVKSSISEFMQYRIGKEEMTTLLEYSKSRGALYYKLKDLNMLYEEFLKYIEGSFITKEETLDLVCSKVSKSKILKDSVIVFDGFTGFTPIQYRLIRKLLHVAREIIVTITIPKSENPYKLHGEEDLFYLSRKTVADILQICNEEHISEISDVFMEDESKRFDGNKCLEHLERNLLRFPVKSTDSDPEGIIEIHESLNPKEETVNVARQIRELIRDEGLKYRDIGIICGDLSAYAEHIKEQFEQFDIPVFIDRTNYIALNPFVEYIRSVLSIIYNNFSYDSVFHFLRSGMAVLSKEEVDEFENYCIRFGIHGKKQFTNVFSKMTKEMSKNPDSFNCINELRSRFVASIEPVLRKADTVKEYINNLYDFLTLSKAVEKLLEYENYFRECNDLEKADEYAQIFRKTMDLFDQIISLLGDEKMTVKEFADIIEAGFGEIRVGLIPQNVDRVIVGDNKRSRINQVKVLFFMGVNDGAIPSKAGNTGLISDMDREFLKESKIEMTPGPRQQMYLQRYYLYLNLTKPSKRLYLSCSKVGNDGTTLKPAYLIPTIRQMFNNLEITVDSTKYADSPVETPRQGLLDLAKGFNRIALVSNDSDVLDHTMSLLSVYREKKLFESEIRDLITAAFYSYEHTPLGKALARELYGKMIMNSVSRLEGFAACQYRHFLKYGLIIEDRDSYEFERKDLGTVTHSVLEAFSKKLQEEKLDWFSFSEAEGNRILDQCIMEVAATYNETVLYSSSRNEYAIERLKRVMRRTIATLQEHLKAGSFIPEKAEVSFNQISSLDAFDIRLSDDERMRIGGRIDRFDVCKEENDLFVKVIDYKTGDTKFDILSLYAGLQLQLVVYMNAAVEIEKKLNPGKDVTPAAMLYYHVYDPVVEPSEDDTPERINNLIKEKLKMSGVINDNVSIVKRIDGDFETKSLIIPVELNKDGDAFVKKSSTYSIEEINILSDFVNRKIAQMGRDILDGNISINPCDKSSSINDSCQYCNYKGVCGFDKNIKGFEKRKIAKKERDELIELMLEETQNGN